MKPGLQTRCALLAAGLLLTAGCIAPARLDLAYTAPPPVRAIAPSALRVCLRPVTDGRDPGDESGVFAGRLILAPNAVRWCQTALNSLVSPATRIVDTSTAQEPGEIVAVPRLRKLHIESVAVSKTATVVLEVDYYRAGRPPVQKYYRGKDVALNWASSGVECEAAFNHAIGQCMSALRHDLEAGVDPSLQDGAKSS